MVGINPYQNLNDLLANNELEEKEELIIFDALVSPDVERTFFLEKEDAFFLFCSAQAFFIREGDYYEAVSPFVFYLSNSKMIHVKTSNNGNVTCLIIDECIYGNQKKSMVNALLDKKQLDFHEFKSLYQSAIIYDFNSQDIALFLRFLVYSLPVILSKKQRERSDRTLFERIEVNIKNNAHISELYVEQVAMLSFCSKRTLQKTLAKQNTSFSELTNKIRVELFCELLLNSKLNIEKISFKCGFNSVSYAIKLFRQTMGLTPNQYRRKFSYEN